MEYIVYNDKLNKTDLSPLNIVIEENVKIEFDSNGLLNI